MAGSMRQQVRTVTGPCFGSRRKVSQDRGEDLSQQSDVESTGRAGIQIDLPLDGALVECDHPSAPLAPFPRQELAPVGELAQPPDVLRADTADGERLAAAAMRACRGHARAVDPEIDGVPQLGVYTAGADPEPVLGPLKAIS